jgi:hypothetical protein
MLRGAFFMIMLNAITLNVAMLNVVILSVVSPIFFHPKILDYVFFPNLPCRYNYLGLIGTSNKSFQMKPFFFVCLTNKKLYHL